MWVNSSVIADWEKVDTAATFVFYLKTSIYSWKWQVAKALSLPCSIPELSSHCVDKRNDCIIVNIATIRQTIQVEPEVSLDWTSAVSEEGPRRKGKSEPNGTFHSWNARNSESAGSYTNRCRMLTNFASGNTIPLFHCKTLRSTVSAKKLVP